MRKAATAREGFRAGVRYAIEAVAERLIGSDQPEAVSNAKARCGVRGQGQEDRSTVNVWGEHFHFDDHEANVGYYKCYPEDRDKHRHLPEPIDAISDAILNALKAVAEETERHCVAPVRTDPTGPPWGHAMNDPRRLGLVRTQLEQAYLWRTGDLPAAP